MITLRNVTKSYDSPAGAVAALEPISLEIGRGEFVSITGRSGSGKSTLLNMIAGLDRPSSGDVEVAGTSVGGLSRSRLAPWRGRTIGVVFQFFQLLPTLTAAENVELPMDFRRTLSAAQRRARAIELLTLVGIPEQAGKLPLTLSGGQQQRAAIARALANEPPVLLADEPTGNLDSETAVAIFGLLRDLSRRGVTVVVATHERDIAGLDRSISLADGVVVSDVRSGGGVLAGVAS